MIDLGSVQKAHAKFLRGHEAMVGRVANAAGKRAVSHVRSNPGFTPRSGALQASTKRDVFIRVGGALIRVKATADHAIFLEKGTRPHTIAAKNKKYLRFVPAGASGPVFRKRVAHPGTKPTRFLSRARDNAYEWAGEALRRDMSRLAHRF